jgi:phage tail-like protein
MASNNNAPGGYYPPVGFFFRVRFLGFSGDNEMRFQQVDGLSVEVKLDDIYHEGGNNTFEYALPTKVRCSDISLKRGLLVGSELFAWCAAAINDFQFFPLDFTVELLNDQGAPLLTWVFTGALPKKWSISSLNAETSSIAIEQIDLAVRDFRIL